MKIPHQPIRSRPPAASSQSRLAGNRPPSIPLPFAIGSCLFHAHPVPSAPSRTARPGLKPADHVSRITHHVSRFTHHVPHSSTPPGFTLVEILVAIGRAGSPDALPEDLRKLNVPNTRTPLRDLISEETFRA
jgi:hypothetical protein